MLGSSILKAARVMNNLIVAREHERDFQQQKEEKKEPVRWFAGRHLVAAQVKFPLWGGNPPAKAKEKEEKQATSSRFRDLFSIDSTNDLL